ncbi:DUF4011 domain-containing protein [Paractinoplanes maris]|uniref:DUF4011 domain-containing protein n=1 Tax=Paractinoplanes maris TaxID=1734446 RepID=UPI0020204940|nr:DUF4011 domain-containing protein [Actinoplanes maris]
MPPNEDARAALAIWRDGLINLGGGNRLINLDRSRPGIITVSEPAAAEIVDAVQRERTACFVPADAEEAPAGRSLPLHVTLEHKTMGPVLRRLLKRVRQEYLDRGVSILYLAVGLLHWTDEDGEGFVSPLLLLPVDLLSQGPRADPVLGPRDDEPLVNPALALRLRELGVELPALDPVADVDLAELWDRVDRVTAGRPGWWRDETVVLSTFTFHKEAMFRDLLENEERVLANPLVEALTTKDHRQQTAAFAFDPIPGDQIDERAAPEDVPLVLDADSSQRACVAAAVAGRSFVMDGPPGTGKSQTIANMIGALLHAGKRVLFVSEKAAALEVVRNRLSEIGLAAYLLELHSAKAGRKEVAGTLAEALDSLPVAPRALDPLRRTAVRERRRQLNRFAEAMNRVRDPLSYSLHDVLGICAQAAELPHVPVPVDRVTELTPQDLNRIDDAADRLRRSWRPVAQQQTCLWRGVVDRDPLLGRVQAATEALAALETVAGVNAELVGAFGLDRPEDAARLFAIVEHARRRPGAARDGWLTIAGFEPVREAFDELRARLSAVRSAEREARDESGVEWRDLPDIAGPSEPLQVEFHQLTAGQDTALADRFAAEVEMLERHTATVDRVADTLRLPRIVTFADAARLAAVAEVAYRPHRPEPFWFGDGATATVRAAADELHRHAVALAEAEQSARRYFTEQAPEAPVDELAERFATVHHGLRRVLGAYRRDKRAVGALTRPEVSPAEALAHLDAAVAWKRARHEFGRAEHDLAGWLGRYWRGRGTDFGAVREALRTTGEVVSTVPAEALPTVVEHICRPVPDEHLIAAAVEARDAFTRWQAAAPRELALGGVREAVDWLRDHEPPLRAAATFITRYAEVIGRDLDFATAQRLGRLRRAAAGADAALVAGDHHYGSVLGAAYRGTATDEAALADALDWTARARRLATGADQPLSPAQVRALSDGRYTEALPDRLAAWRTARTRIVDAFAAHRHAELLADLDDYDHARTCSTTCGPTAPVRRSGSSTSRRGRCWPNTASTRSSTSAPSAGSPPISFARWSRRPSCGPGPTTSCAATRRCSPCGPRTGTIWSPSISGSITS